jgi:hypothetical protein
MKTRIPSTNWLSGFAQADFFGLLSGTNGARLYRGRTHIRQARIKSVK